MYRAIDITDKIVPDKHIGNAKKMSLQLFQNMLHRKSSN